jgi:hypothetical protein
MRSQENAATQLREYFLQPLEFSRILAAERLIESLNEKDKGLATRDIVAAIVSGLYPNDGTPYGRAAAGASSGSSSTEAPESDQKS